MKTINATKQELITIVNGLVGVQDLKGKDFSLVVSKNMNILRKALKDIEEAGKPSKEFLAVAEKVNEIANNNPEDAQAEINKIEEENKELVEARRKQMAKIEEMMRETTEVELEFISKDLLPEDISPAQLNKLSKIIE
tara:strand:+ start:123 stop:536 length:414 start_codon:yes stop_codon:yes gene_type:complete